MPGHVPSIRSPTAAGLDLNSGFAGSGPRPAGAWTLAVARWLDRSRWYLGLRREVEHDGRPRVGESRTEAEGFK